MTFLESLRARLISLAGAYLTKVRGGSIKRFVVCIKVRGESHEFIHTGDVVPECMLAGECSCGRGCVRVVYTGSVAGNVAMYSHLEAKILGGLCGGEWVTTATLAEAIGEPLTNDLRVVIRNLGERGALETSQKYGVRLTGAGSESVT